MECEEVVRWGRYNHLMFMLWFFRAREAMPFILGFFTLGYGVKDWIITPLMKGLGMVGSSLETFVGGIFGMLNENQQKHAEQKQRLAIREGYITATLVKQQETLRKNIDPPDEENSLWKRATVAFAGFRKLFGDGDKGAIRTRVLRC